MDSIAADEDVMRILEERSAILKGHFLLSSGLHSDTYVQCAKLQEIPSVCERVCALLLRKAKVKSDVLDKVDLVVSPAMGGIVFGYEIARQLGVDFMFAERVDGCMTLRRGFTIRNDAKVLVVEDVITTGKSSLEILDVVSAAGGAVVGELSIVDRGKGLEVEFPVISLISLNIRNYSEGDMPDALRGIPISSPGSRFLQKEEWKRRFSALVISTLQMHLPEDGELHRYARQILVPGIGIEGQQRMKSSTVLVVGCGGLGSSVVPMLAASGIGRLVLYDDDTVKITDLNRQVIYRESDIGRKKVDAAEEFIKALNSEVEVSAVAGTIGPENCETVIKDVDIVIDCVDRLAVKVFLNDACVALNAPLIHMVAIGFTGEVMTILPGGRPCYRCFFEAEHLGINVDCANSGVIGPAVGVIGNMAAVEAIKYLTGNAESSWGRLYRMDFRANTFNTYMFEQNVGCLSCGKNRLVDPYEWESYGKAFSKRHRE